MFSRKPKNLLNKKSKKLDDLERKMLFTAVFGKRGSGKTTLVRSLLKEEMKKKTYDYFIIFKNSPSQEYMINSFNFNFEHLEKLLNFQERQIKKGIFKPIFIIFDDCFTSFIYTNKKKNKLVRNLFFNGRHFLIGVCLVSQYMNLLKSEIRANIDKLYIKYTLNMNVIDKFIEDYGDKYQKKYYYHEITRTFKTNHYSTFLFDCFTGKLYEIEY